MNLAFVLLLVSIMLVPHILGWSPSLNINTQYAHSNIHSIEYCSDGLTSSGDGGTSGSLAGDRIRFKN
jgi:hypothetical protein